MLTAVHTTQRLVELALTKEHQITTFHSNYFDYGFYLSKNLLVDV